MRIVLLEDETLAARRLMRLLADLRPQAHILATLESVEEAVSFFKEKQAIDLIFMDIQLADGLCFELFHRVDLPAPVVFTTAYDAYALQAFEVNGMDYLLKPINEEKLEKSLAKYEKLYQKAPVLTPQLEQLIAAFQKPQSYKDRFLIRQADRLLSIEDQQVAYFRAEEKVVFLHTLDGKKHIVDHTLDELERAVNPKLFFRLNRQFLATLPSIKGIFNYQSGKLLVEFAKGLEHPEVFVSREKAAKFREWLGG